MPICPECGGDMRWDRESRFYVCKRCGLALSRKELDELKEKAMDEIIPEEKKRKRMRREYLEWWLSQKKE